MPNKAKYIPSLLGLIWYAKRRGGGKHGQWKHKEMPHIWLEFLKEKLESSFFCENKIFTFHEKSKIHVGHEMSNSHWLENRVFFKKIL